jgi:hypothetical protein
MSRLPGLYQWNDVVGKRFPRLSKPMAACLALWSLGMIVARSCSLTAVAWAWVPKPASDCHGLTPGDVS